MLMLFVMVFTTFLFFVNILLFIMSMLALVLQFKFPLLFPSLFPDAIYLVRICLQNVVQVLFYLLVINVDVLCVGWYENVRFLLLKILYLLVHSVIVLHDIYFCFYYSFLELLKVVSVIPLSVELPLGLLILHFLILVGVFAWLMGVLFFRIARRLEINQALTTCNLKLNYFFDAMEAPG